MEPEAAKVVRLVDAAMAEIADPSLAQALRACLVSPARVLLRWDYGHPHPEFAEPCYPAFIVAVLGETRTGIAYSEYGFGPGAPWGLVWLDRLGYGMDSGWYRTLEGAFRESMLWDEPPPPGYEVD
jgi:hypothetical protein